MKICLVATFPPSGRQLNEYAFHIARELQRNPTINLTILADELSDYQFATDENGEPLSSRPQAELPGFNVIRCWKFNDLATPVRLLSTIRKLKPDVVWFNLVFSTFAHPGTSSGRVCGTVGAGSDSRARLLHPRHAAPHHRARRFCQRRRAPGKNISPWQRHGHPGLADGQFGFGFAFRLPAHSD